MKVMFIADFHTDGDFGFYDFDNLFDKTSFLYKGAEVEYLASKDDYHIYFRLCAHGEPNPCRWAVRDLLENMICSIRTHKYYLVGELFDLLNYFRDELWGDMNQDKESCMSGNYDGTYVALHMREE